MAHRIEAPAITVPAGTAIAAAIRFPLDWQDGEVQRIEVRVPPGPSGLVGFAIGHSNQVIHPRTPGQWFVVDGDKLEFDLEGQPTGNAWFVDAYNTDFYDHTLYVVAHLRELALGALITVAPLRIVQPDMPVVVDE